MTGLIVAETQRLLSRRMTRFFPLALGVVMIAGIGIAILVAGDDGPDFARDIVSGRWGGANDVSTDVLGPMGLLVPIMAFVIGASFFGADQKSGMIEQLLTWEPRRMRLLLGRLAGGMPAVFVITAILSTFLVVLLYIFSSISGTTDGASDVLPKILGAIVRSGITGAIFFALGMVVTVIANNSTGSIVGFLIYVFVIELALLQPLVPKVAVWLPIGNADAFVARTGVASDGLFTDGFGRAPEFHHGWFTAGLLLAAFTAIVSVAAIAIFTRRDID